MIEYLEETVEFKSMQSLQLLKGKHTATGYTKLLIDTDKYSDS